VSTSADHGPPAGDPSLGAGDGATSTVPTGPGGTAGPQATSSRGVSVLATVAIALIAGLIGFAIGAATGTAGDASDTVAATAEGRDTEAVDASAGTGDADAADAADAGASPEAPGASDGIDARPVMGSADAPVDIEVFSDFGCPFCHRHDQEVEPELIARYVETGQARLVWYDVPFQGPVSTQLHVAARAAHRQDRFWEFKEATFQTDGRDASPDMLRALATEAGLDLGQFEQDLDDPALLQLVLDDLQYAPSVGVTGTPAFLIDGRLLMGAQPLPAFTELLDASLSEADAAPAAAASS
jgi:protein-disulfide isomerase